MDLEDEARQEPKVGVGKVDRLADTGSTLILFDKEEGYDPVGSF